MSSKINWPQALLGMTALTLAAVVIRPSAFEDPPPPPAPKVKTVVQTKVVEKVKEKRVVVNVNKQPDGYVSREECFGIPEDMPVAELMYRFGWPHGRNGRAMGLGDADYPIREDHDAKCTVRFPYGTVSSVSYHHDMHDYGGTETWDDTH